MTSYDATQDHATLFEQVQDNLEQYVMQINGQVMYEGLKLPSKTILVQEMVGLLTYLTITEMNMEIFNQFLIMFAKYIVKNKQTQWCLDQANKALKENTTDKTLLIINGRFKNIMVALIFCAVCNACVCGACWLYRRWLSVGGVFPGSAKRCGPGAAFLVCFVWCAAAWGLLPGSVSLTRNLREVVYLVARSAVLAGVCGGFSGCCRVPGESGRGGCSWRSLAALLLFPYTLPL